MMKTMVVTAELLEPVPRSVILASLTNDLPSGVSLTELDLDTKETKTYKPANQKAGASQYSNKSAAANEAQSTEPTTKTETILDMKGIAPSDIQVASYIANLSLSILLDNVELVESKELEIDDLKFREFRLKAMLKPNLTLSKEDINQIREKSQKTI